jgi:excisionase family DNA binding protein
MAGAHPLTILEVARELQIDAAEVYELVFSQQLGFTQAANGRILVPRDALDEYIASHRAPTG